MSLFDYEQSQQIDARHPTFAALIMAAIRKADSDNAEKLREAFPAIFSELVARYNAPGGKLKNEK